MENLQIIKVICEDICFISDYSSINDLEKMDVLSIEIVGFFVFEDEKKLILINENEINSKYKRVTWIIPKTSVKEIIKLKEE